MKISLGDIVIYAASGDYGKPRPAIIVQSDLFNEKHASITLCPITSDLSDTPMIRITIHPNSMNGLKNQSQVMIDKIVSIPREKIKQIAGKISANEMDLIQDVLRRWLGLD